MFFKYSTLLLLVTALFHFASSQLADQITCDDRTCELCAQLVSEAQCLGSQNKCCRCLNQCGLANSKLDEQGSMVDEDVPEIIAKTLNAELLDMQSGRDSSNLYDSLKGVSRRAFGAGLGDNLEALKYKYGRRPGGKRGSSLIDRPNLESMIHKDLEELSLLYQMGGSRVSGFNRGLKRSLGRSSANSRSGKFGDVPLYAGLDDLLYKFSRTGRPRYN